MKTVTRAAVLRWPWGGFGSLPSWATPAAGTPRCTRPPRRPHGGRHRAAQRRCRPQRAGRTRPRCTWPPKRATRRPSLLEAPMPDPNVRTRKGLSPLHWAAATRRPAPRAQGPCRPQRAEQGRGTPRCTGPLEWRGGRHRAAQGPCDPNAQNKDCWSTPLHLAAEWNKSPEVITALLDAGAAANIQDAYGKQPFDYAKGNRAIRGSQAYWRLNDGRF